MKKQVIFCRVSSSKQDVESQLIQTKQYAIQLGYLEENFIIISAVGASAYIVNQFYEQTLEQLKKYICSGEISAVICWHLNRLARNDVIAMELKQLLIENHVQLHIKEPTISLLNADGSPNPGAELCFALFATMNRQQIDELKEKSKRGKQHLNNQGLFSGGSCPFGYYIDENKRFQIDDIEANTVYMIFDMYINGYSTFQINDELRLQNKAFFDNSTISKILKRKSYCGDKFRPAIIDKEVFEKVQELLKKNAHPRTKVHYHFCARLIKCGCGGTYSGTGKFYRCYIENKRSHLAVDTYHTPNITIKYLDGLVYKLVYEKVQKDMIKSQKINRDNLIKKIDACSQKSIKLATDMDKFKSKYKRVQDMYIDGDITKKEYEQKKSELAIKENDMKNQLKQYEIELNRLTDIFVQKDIYNPLDGNNAVEVQRIVQKYVNVIYLTYNRKLTIHFNDNTIFECYYCGYWKCKFSLDETGKKPIDFPVIIHNGDTFSIEKPSTLTK